MNVIAIVLTGFVVTSCLAPNIKTKKSKSTEENGGTGTTSQSLGKREVIQDLGTVSAIRASIQRGEYKLKANLYHDCDSIHAYGSDLHYNCWSKSIEKVGIPTIPTIATIPTIQPPSVNGSNEYEDRRERVLSLRKRVFSNELSIRRGHEYNCDSHYTHYTSEHMQCWEGAVHPASQEVLSVVRKRGFYTKVSSSPANLISGITQTFDLDVAAGKSRVKLLADGIVETTSGPTLFIGRMRRTTVVSLYNGGRETMLCIQITGWESGRCKNPENWSLARKSNIVPFQNIEDEKGKINPYSWKMRQRVDTGVTTIFKKFKLDYFEGREVEIFYKNNEKIYNSNEKSHTSVRFFVESKTNYTYIYGSDPLATMSESKRSQVQEEIVVENYKEGGIVNIASRSFGVDTADSLNKRIAVIYHCGEGCEVCMMAEGDNKCTGTEKNRHFSSLAEGNLGYDKAVDQYMFKFKYLDKELMNEFKGKTIEYYLRKGPNYKTVIKGLSIYVAPNYE